jgi:hypothetical protein
MKKINLLLLFAVSGLMVTVSELKAEAMMNPYMQADEILWDVVGYGHWREFEEAKKNPEKYLTALQLKAYNAEVAKEKARIKAQEADELAYYRMHGYFPANK